MTEPTDHPAIGLLRDWFNRGQSGCKFASRLASRDPRLAFWVHLERIPDLDLDDVSAFVDDAAADGDVSLIVLPRAMSDGEIIELARHLSSSERWLVQAHECPQHLGQISQRYAGLGVEFITSSRDRSRAMGFAPSGFMPVTRRAPFLVLALWAGGRSNPYFDYSPKGTVNMADVDTRLEHAAYDSTWQSSVEDTRRRLLDPPHDAKWLRRVAFCLARSDIASHWPLSST